MNDRDPLKTGMQELLTRWDTAVRAGVSRFNPVVPHVANHGTVLRDGAAAEDVAAAERRLGVTFPQSYREFLWLSNGAWATSLGVSSDENLQAELLPVERVRWFTEVDPDHVQDWAEGVGSFDEPEEDAHPGDEPVEVWDFERMREALVVGVNFDGMYELLVPREGAEEWEVWQTYKEGATTHRSFADFLRYEADNAPRPSDLSHAEEYASAALNAQDPGALHQLAEVDGERALAVALEILRGDYDDGTRSNAVSVLSLLQDPAAVPILRAQLDATPVGDYTIRSGLLSALERCRAPEARELWLEESRSSPHEYIRDQARWHAEQL